MSEQITEIKVELKPFDYAEIDRFLKEEIGKTFRIPAHLLIEREQGQNARANTYRSD